MRFTWSCIFELLLNDVDKLLDLSRWSAPENQAVPRINIVVVSLMAV